MYFLYQLGVYLYYVFVRIASLFNKKAMLWIQGRNAQQETFRTPLPASKRIWFHFASLGEFEQGRSVLEQIHQQYPAYKIIITFFSPSGYEIRKNYSLAEKVYYLPLDTSANAIEFYNHINPSFVFFTKYEYWYHYIKEANRRKIPLVVISSIFRENQLFFKSYGNFQRKILSLVNHFFVQNVKSQELLNSIQITNVSIAGDTRFDRVYEHSLNPTVDKCIQGFSTGAEVFVAGSTWPKDEELLVEFSKAFPNFKYIIVPHEIGESKVQYLQKLFGEKSALYSEYKEKDIPAGINVLIVDTIGLLNSIYKIAKYTYIGGGFGVGIHNTLEAAAYGMPIFFGPNYQKFSEAKDLIANRAASSINNSDELIQLVQVLENDKKLHQEISRVAKDYVYDQKGATKIILDYIRQNNLIN